MSLPVQDKCVHCNLSLSSNLSANAPSHPLSSCSSSSFTSSCSTSLPSVLLSSLSRSPRPSFFFLSHPPTSHLAIPLPAARGVDRRWLSLISFAPPSGSLTHSIHTEGWGGGKWRSWWNPQRSAWTHLSFLGSQQTSGLMSHWIITVCGIVCDTLWIFIYGHPKHVFLPSLLMNHFDVMWDVLRARLTVEITGSIPVRQNNSQLHDLRWCWAVLNKKYLIDASTGKALKESVFFFFTVLVLMNFMCMLLYTFTFHMVRYCLSKNNGSNQCWHLSDTNMIISWQFHKTQRQKYFGAVTAQQIFFVFPIKLYQGLTIAVADQKILLKFYSKKKKPRTG